MGILCPVMRKYTFAYRGLNSHFLSRYEIMLTYKSKFVKSFFMCLQLCLHSAEQKRFQSSKKNGLSKR